MSEANTGATAPNSTVNNVVNPTAQNPQTNTSTNIPSAAAVKAVGTVGESDVQAILSEDGQAPKAAETKDTQKQINELKKKLKLKVNGREIEKEIDFSNEDDLREAYQKAMAAEQTWQESAKIKKQMAQLADALKNDPFALMREAGLDPDELTAKYMEERLKEYEKSPEQRQLEELQKEVEKERKRREELENEKTTAEQERIKSEYMRDLDDQITNALNKSSTPKSAMAVKMIAQYLSIGLDQGKQLTVDQVVPMVEKRMNADMREHINALSEEALEKFLGEEILGKLKKRRMARMKQVDSANSIQATGQGELAKIEAKNKPKERASLQDTRNFWNKR